MSDFWNYASGIYSPSTMEGWMDNLDGNTGNNAYASYLQQIPSMLQKYYGPYQQMGESEIAPYQDTVNTLMDDPTGFVNNIMQSYKPSQMNQNNMASMLTASDHASAAGGTLGTGEQTYDVQKTANNLSMGDQTQYLQQILAPFYQGLNGGNSMIGMGLNATNDLTQGLMENTQGMGALAQQHGNNTMQGLMGLGMAALMFL